jgi:hypothetical protein
MDTWTTLTLHRHIVCELQRDAARRRLAKIASRTRAAAVHSAGAPDLTTTVPVATERRQPQDRARRESA